MRLAGALGVGLAASLYVTEPPLRWGLWGIGSMLVLTGLVGFCPACYVAGRKLKDRVAP